MTFIDDAELRLTQHDNFKYYRIEIVRNGEWVPFSARIYNTKEAAIKTLLELRTMLAPRNEWNPIESGNRMCLGRD